MELIITTEGDLRTITHTEEEVQFCRQIGRTETKRASHIEPCNWVLRHLFHAIRSRCQDDSKWSQWTRGWNCLWRVRIFNGPTFGQFKDRALAIQAEENWLMSRNLKDPLDDTTADTTSED